MRSYLPNRRGHVDYVNRMNIQTTNRCFISIDDQFSGEKEKLTLLMTIMQICAMKTRKKINEKRREWNVFHVREENDVFDKANQHEENIIKIISFIFQHPTE